MVPSQLYENARKDRNSVGRMRFESLLLTAGNKDVVIPINKNDHWSLIFLKNDVAVFYDSMMFQDLGTIKIVETVTKIKQWYQLQGRKQNNLIDCGVYMLAMVWNLCHRSESTKNTSTCQLHYWIASHCARIKTNYNRLKVNHCQPAVADYSGKRSIKKISFSSIIKLSEKDSNGTGMFCHY